MGIDANSLVLDHSPGGLDIFLVSSRTLNAHFNVLQQPLTSTAVLQFGSATLDYEFCVVTPTNPHT